MSNNGKKFKGITARTLNQKRFIQAVNEKDFVICSAVAGTGKSIISVGLACEYLVSNKVDKIVFVRNSCHLVKEFGYSVGSWREKGLSLFDQVVEYFIRFLGESTFRQLWAENTIELTSTSLIRGRSWEKTFIVYEEAQLASKEDLILFISRVDKNSKCLLIGDIEQSKDDFFEKLINNINDEDVAVVQMTEEDIQRNKHMYRICKKIRAI